MGKDCPNFLQPFLENIDERAVKTGTGRLFQYFTTLTENAELLLQLWVVPLNTL